MCFGTRWNLMLVSHECYSVQFTGLNREGLICWKIVFTRLSLDCGIRRKGGGFEMRFMVTHRISPKRNRKLISPAGKRQEPGVRGNWSQNRSRKYVNLHACKYKPGRIPLRVKVEVTTWQIIYIEDICSIRICKLSSQGNGFWKQHSLIWFPCMDSKCIETRTPQVNKEQDFTMPVFQFSNSSFHTT